MSAKENLKSHIDGLARQVETIATSVKRLQQRVDEMEVRVSSIRDRFVDVHTPYGFATPPPQTEGCVCESGAERTCSAPNCPRKPATVTRMLTP